MKKPLVLLLLIMPLFALAQIEFATVQLPFDCEDYELEGVKIAQLPNDNYFLLAKLTYNNQTFPCTFVQDPNGNTLSSHFYSTGYVPFSFDIHEGSSSVYITGHAEDQTVPKLYVSNVDYTGALSWEREYEIVDTRRHVAPKIEIIDNDIYIHSAVIPTSASGLRDDMLIWNLDLAGNVVNRVRYCTDISCLSGDDEISGFDILNNGNMIFSGKTGPSVLEGMFHEVDLGLGSVSHVRTTRRIAFRGVLAHSTGTIVSAGEDLSTTNQTVLLMMDYSYNVGWSIQFSVDNSRLLVRDIYEGDNETIIVQGEIDNGTNEYIILLYFDVDGNLLSAKRHITSRNTGVKYFDVFTGNTVAGFANVTFTRNSTTYNTVESFVANQFDNLCIFEEPQVSITQTQISFTNKAIYDNDFELVEGEFFDVAPIDLIERHICFPCNQRVGAARATSISGGSATESALNESLEFEAEDVIASAEDKIVATSSYISPNPAKDQLNINLSESEDSEQQLIIYNLKGTKVMEEVVRGGTISTLDLSLDKGIYMIMIDDVSFGKLVVQ